MREAARAALADRVTPLDFLLATVRDEDNGFATRLNAAKAAAPYVHAKLATVEVGGIGGGNLVVEFVRFSDATAR
jgi:hypothetical protein